MYEIFFYETEDGKCPVEEFLHTMEPKMLAKALRIIDLLEHNGSRLREPYSKFLRNGIFELRIKQGTNITRLLYFFMIEKKIIITNGFWKKTQKTPKEEIRLAEKYMEEYKRRHRENEVSGL